MAGACLGIAALAAGADADWLPHLTRGRVGCQNALWTENALTAQFQNSNRVVVADVGGPAVITMMHFAMPQSHFVEPIQLLNRDLLLRIYWDGESDPSVDVPLVDFFCDPNGTREEVSNAFLNKRRGFNCYFQMPFDKSAKVELVYDGAVKPGKGLWRLMPCYSYVMYRTLDDVDDDTGYFHAWWRQEGIMLGRREYLALDAQGRGKFVGWNVTMRLPGRDNYPVDQNEKFYVDGEASPSIEFQGIEDSFGFSWGFPREECQFPMTGFYKFMKGAMGYRFFKEDAIGFEKSLRVEIGFGANEAPMFRKNFSKRGNMMQFSSTAYWYQIEPHAAFPPMLASAERTPAPEEAFWPEKEEVPDPEALKGRGVMLRMLCGRSKGETVFAEEGYAAKAVRGYTFEGWPLPVYHCRASEDIAEMALTVPKGAAGTVRVFVIDPDDFKGGRHQVVMVAGRTIAEVDNFGEGRWLETQVSSAETAEGQVIVGAKNLRKGSNAVLSIIEWVAAPR